MLPAKLELPQLPAPQHGPHHRFHFARRTSQATSAFAEELGSIASLGPSHDFHPHHFPKINDIVPSPRYAGERVRVRGRSWYPLPPLTPSLSPEYRGEGA